MTVRRLTAEPATDHRAELGEGPVWDADRNRVVWVDIPGRAILVTDPSTGHTESLPTPSEIGAVALVGSGGYVAALQDGVYLGDGTEPWQLLAEIEASDETMRMNDGKCDPHGAFVGGTISRDGKRGVASLYRVNEQGTTERLLTGVSISNGLDWTADGTTMYYIDTPTRTVMAYPYDYGSPTLGQPEPVVEIPESQGFPDGMTLDSEGCLWVGMWGGHAIHRYTPNGILDTVIDLPVTNVTSCAFGGQDFGTLFITTASSGADEKDGIDEPMAGALFQLQVGVSGRPPTPFGSNKDRA
ncbi:MAG: SMP-30/gluconolactonase/LRE family protein [Acidimicrobiia bacterium]|nr:MAG: SMP-30/gluconolactonase/LRE family protein [Acidimicrobiia bacterium]